MKFYFTVVLPLAGPSQLFPHKPTVEMLGAEGKMKQFASWFTHGVPGGAGLRKAIYESKSAPETLSRVEEFFEARLDATGGLALQTGAVVPLG